MTMVAQDFRERLQARGSEALHLARWLGAPPDEALLHGEAEDGLLRALGVDTSALPPLIDLQVEHAALFAAPGPGHVSACESVYRDRFTVEFTGCGLAGPAASMPVEGLLWGPTTPRVLAVYRAAGWDIPEGCPLPPDHFALELEFYGRLLTRSGEDPSFADVARRFLDEHLGAWASKFLGSVLDRPGLRFYHRLAAVLLEWIEREAARGTFGSRCKVE